MSIGLRIKELRKNKNISQIDFANMIGIKQSPLSQMESGKILPSLETISNIIRVFNISYSWLIDGVSEETKSEKNVVKKNDHKNDHTDDHNPNVKKMYTNDLLQIAYENKAPAVVTIDSNNEDNIALVSVPLCAGYLKGYDNPNFIAKLPTFRMPGLNHGIFRMFEVEGHSMFPTLPNKSYVVGQFVENWIRDIRDNQIYAVISNEVEGGLVKRCINKIKKYNNLICKSDNRRDYPTQNINPESIKEIWEIKLHLNFQLPDPADIYDRMTDLEGEVSSLEGKVLSLESVIRQSNLPSKGV